EVMIAGKVLARRGASEVATSAIDLPSEMMRSLRVGMVITPDTMRISSPNVAARIRVMELVNQTITAERIIEVKTPARIVEANLDEDLLKVAMFDRHHSSTTVAFGFIKGFGAQVGAIGLTTNLDENSLLVVGSDDRDMALCANALLDAGGGIVIVNAGEILEKIDFPFGGIFSLRPWQEVGSGLRGIQTPLNEKGSFFGYANFPFGFFSLRPWQEVGSGLRRIQTRLKEMGSSFDKPIFPLSFLPFVTLPALRITARGLVDAKERKVVPLFAA